MHGSVAPAGLAATCRHPQFNEVQAHYSQLTLCLPPTHLMSPSLTLYNFRHADFVSRYKILLPAQQQDIVLASEAQTRAAVLQLLAVFKVAEGQYEMGRTKVFFKPGTRACRIHTCAVSHLHTHTQKMDKVLPCLGPCRGYASLGKHRGSKGSSGLLVCPHVASSSYSRHLGCGRFVGPCLKHCQPLSPRGNTNEPQYLLLLLSVSARV